MKIALLNLPLDNNYGGNLQRYALMTVLNNMGHDVTHINLRIRFKLPWYKKPYSYSKRILNRYILRKSNIIIFKEQHDKEQNEIKTTKTREFYNKYIKHTEICYSINDIIKQTNGRFDAFIVGSDQVWRREMTGQIGLKNYFLGFVGDKVKKIAYAVSLGVDNNNLSKKEINTLSTLYNRFQAVSVREDLALQSFDNYIWRQPKAELTLDPTLLLGKENYDLLISKTTVSNLTSGKMFCYVLEPSSFSKQTIIKYSKSFNLEYEEMGLNGSDNISIEQWLNNIRQAKIVITDSYHGVVFSIIYNRPFLFLGNQLRGNARVESLFRTLGINQSEGLVNPSNIDNAKFKEMQTKSLNFLLRNLR